MGLFDLFKSPSPEAQAQQAASAQRQADILESLRSGSVPASTRIRLEAARSGSSPWIATLTPAELFITRSHGIRPIASVSATCWLHYGWSWTLGHSQGWETALRRLREEAKAAGANAVLDVKMRTIPLGDRKQHGFYPGRHGGQNRRLAAQLRPHRCHRTGAGICQIAGGRCGAHWHRNRRALSNG